MGLIPINSTENLCNIAEGRILFCSRYPDSFLSREEINLPTKLVIGDRHSLHRKGLCCLLARCPGFEVIGETDNGAQVVEMVRREEPHVALIEIDLPGKDGLDVIRDIVMMKVRTQVVVLTTFFTTHHAIRALRAGARGFISKDSSLQEVQRAIHKVGGGQTYLASELQSAVAERYFHSRGEDPIDLLTDRELQVMRLLAAGYNHHEIGEKLFISVKTVDTHRSNLLRKTGLRNNADVTRFAIQHGFVSFAGAAEPSPMDSIGLREKMS